MKSLEEMIRDLPPDAQRQVADFVRQLAESAKPAPKRKLDQRCAGALVLDQDRPALPLARQLDHSPLERREVAPGTIDIEQVEAVADRSPCRADAVVMMFIRL